MGRNLKNAIRCSDCKMKIEICICPLLTKIKNKTFVTILMHKRETITTTNTGRIAHKLLENSEVHYRGNLNKPLTSQEILKETYAPVYLFPTPNAPILTPALVETYNKPIQLIIPDGSWRQAKKFAKREPALKNIPAIQLPPGLESLFFLRKKVHEDGVSTLEAIAYALGTIEGSHIKEHLLCVFKTMIERTLKTRGQSLEKCINNTNQSLP